ncbi:MAG: endonuclease MutS2 [Kaiparowitsia implicata GSE-PSE-MK54-09C]|jgi:DNA mismatch repair protein MutS2|nr:endonuclease MutS2 [Kaiparowitsia implicata GSE-PSE-MK54-09C]
MGRYSGGIPALFIPQRQTLTDLSPIQQETLNLLEWPRLCQQVATFAATKLGAIAARSLLLPTCPTDSAALLAQTTEAYLLETTLPGGLTFDGIHDIGDAVERAGLQGVLRGEELLAIATTLAGVRQLRRTIDNQDPVPTLQALVSPLRTYPDLEQEIHRCIDERAQVADRASVKLAGIREQLKHQRDRIYQILNGIMQRQANALQESLITQRGDRFVLPVKAPQKDAIPGVVHDASTSGATLYVEPHAIVSLGNQMRQLLRQEQAEEEAVRRALSEQVAAVQEDLEELLAIATLIDLATARARYSLWLGANPPRFVPFAPDSSNATAHPATPTSKTNSEPIVLRQLRHPLLVWQQQHEQGTAVVPIDLVIQPHLRVVAITGPNTGGKTVTLKTLGLAALMAKAGLFVPAREPVELPWFEQVLADIGDEQSLQQSLSTFSGHIRRIGRILEALAVSAAASSPAVTRDSTEASESSTAFAKGFTSIPPTDVDSSEPSALIESLASEASEKEETQTLNVDHPNRVPAASPALSPALVLLDEVGAGTDPTEGSALAIALLRHLADHALLTVATTHFGELKALKYDDARFENASVEFDDVQLAPTYRLLWGIPGRSNALTIAQRLGLDAAIVQAAQQTLGVGATQDVNQVIAGLEQQRRQQEEKNAAAADLLRQTEQLHREIARRAELLAHKERELKQQQELEVQRAIAQAKGEIAGVIRRLQRGNTSAQEAQQATESVEQIAARRLPSQQQPPKPKPGFRPQAGDRVRIPRLGQTAEVLTQADANGELMVRFGIMKMSVALADVESLQGEKAELPPKREPVKETRKPDPQPVIAPPAPPTVPTVRTSRNTVDLRGSRVADAEIVLDRAIASADMGPLWIIHGHGTGKLRQGVHEFLKQHPQIERFEPAEKADGGTGVTVAYVL